MKEVLKVKLSKDVELISMPMEIPMRESGKMTNPKGMESIHLQTDRITMEILSRDSLKERENLSTKHVKMMISCNMLGTGRRANLMARGELTIKMGITMKELLKEDKEAGKDFIYSTLTINTKANGKIMVFMV